MSEINKREVGKRIKSIRLQLGLTQENFGGLFDATKGNVATWEKGSSLPTADRIKKIAIIGNIDVNELLYGKQTTQQMIINEFKHVPSNLKANIRNKLIQFIDRLEDNYSLPFVNEKDRFYFLSLLNKFIDCNQNDSQNKEKVINDLVNHLFSELANGIEMQKYFIVSTSEIIQTIYWLINDDEVFYNFLIKQFTEALEIIGKKDKTVTNFIISQKINNLSDNINDFVSTEQIDYYKPNNMLYKDNVIDTLNYDTYTEVITTLNKLQNHLNNHHADK